MKKLILSPKKINSLDVRNRMIMGSMHMGFERKDKGEPLAQFYAARAKGGVGLIITGGSPISPEGASDSNSLHIWNKEHEEALRKTPKAVHEAGGKVALQLFHAGRYAREDLTKLQPVAPSAIPTRISPTLARELTNEEIEQIIEAFGVGAKRAREYGYDAVEIMGSEGYLINQFISPVTNKRTDRWGGSFENRIRFPLEVVKRIRHDIGDDYPVIFRLSGIDLMPNSTTLEETTRLAKTLELHGVDALNIGIGWHESRVPTVQTSVPNGTYAPIAAHIKQNVTVPIIVSNRINNPNQAEDFLVNNVADFIQMARPFLADAFFVHKMIEQKDDLINTCIGCNQSCLDKYFTGLPSSCLVNPSAGREQLFTHRKTENKQQIAVIGGGPAGLEASKALAQKGHNITLYEKSNRLGGQFKWAYVVPGKEDYQETIRYYEHKLNHLRVTVKLNKNPTASELSSYDHIVLATGVNPRKVTIQGADLPHVLNYKDYFEGKQNIGNEVAIIGAGGIAVDIAHRLTDPVVDEKAIVFLMQEANLTQEEVFELTKPKRNVHMMRRGSRVAPYVGRTRRWISMQEMDRKGVQIHTNIQYDSITKEGITIIKDDEKQFIQADTVILAAGQVPNSSLKADLVSKGFQEIAIPDVEPFYEGNGSFESLTLQNDSKKALFVIGGARDTNQIDAERAILEGSIVAHMLP